MEMFFIIMIIICIVGFCVSNEYQKKQKQQIKKYILGCKYIDGTLKIFDNNVDMGLTIEPDYIALTSEPYKTKLSYDKLVDYNLKTTEEISEHLTLTRVLMLGIFALGAKKKKKTVEKFIVLEFLDDNNKEQTAILQTPFPELSTAGMKRLHEFKTQYDNKTKMNINKEIKVDA
ncbi:hypothetical protein [Clostridium botulinum]|uniref:hypothetical protein n=1 Tax=Clostridium botulinum TaxID=1491 RepID=UPI001E5F38EC|nr:hypothetical protein [Clostridium botulinum]MCD3329282.1 hypothetical protein [Clostridium botulinum D/C]MCD3335172.1 hypothetical protein [Clostridium botulinum D/C]MCD3343849.1 hypothetical protein [Clostridium botulinum D/C]MCD3352418.1 hypothetical protein [Clostridium botulinum D/C]